jgi:hypothetical protein
VSGEEHSVRWLRVTLARGLAAAADATDGARMSGALAELDRALAEPGDDPPDADIQFAAGEILERTDPARALRRYVAALEGSTTDAALDRAQHLVRRSTEPNALLASLPVGAIDKVRALALDSSSVAACLLATAMLRRHDRSRDALAVLEHACASGAVADPEVQVQRAEILLELDRCEDVLSLVEREDPQGHNGSLQLLRAHANLMTGNAMPALAVADALLDDDQVASTAAAIKALSLAALDRLDDALASLPMEPAPEIHLVRALVHLQRREYAEAREASWLLLRARPADPDSLLINAQTVVEALDVPAADESDVGATPDGGPVAGTGGSAIDAARGLLKEVATELESLGPTSPWWRGQETLRRDDGRFQFFRCELAFATGEPVDVDEIAAVDTGQTTWLQDAALAERTADLRDRAGDRAGAADAHDEAGSIFANFAIDVVRAAERARDAYDRDPTADRATRYGEASLSASYEPALTASDSKQLLDDGLAAADGALLEADDAQFAKLLNLCAWLRGRRAEITTEPRGQLVSVLLPWLFAGLAVEPDDAILRALAASQLADLDRDGGAALWARDACDALPGNPFVVETAAVTTANYYSDPAAVRPLLEQHATVSDDEAWRNTLELWLCQTIGDRDGMRERLRRPLTEARWADRLAAVTNALIFGIPAARDDLERARDAARSAEPPARLDALFLSSVLRDASQVDTLLASLADEPEQNPADRDWATLVRRFAFDLDASVDEFLVQALPFLDSPSEVQGFVNVALPMLAAARVGATGEVTEVATPREVLDARLHELEQALPHWFDELDGDAPGLGSLAHLADRAVSLSESMAAVGAAKGACPPELRSVFDRVARMVTARASAALLPSLLSAVVGGRESIAPDDVGAVLDGTVVTTPGIQVAIALLADQTNSERARQLVAGASDHDDEVAAEVVLQTVREVHLSVESWWRLDDALAARGAEGVGAAPRVVDRVRASLLLALGELAGFSAAWEPVEQRRPLAITLGPDLIPADPESGWPLFSELLPAIRARVMQDTGYEMPAATVIPDRQRHNAMRLIAYASPLQVVAVPTSGWVRRTADSHSELRDPLTGMPVTVEHTDRRPRDSWTPLEFAMRHLEWFVREHLADFVSFADVSDSAWLLGPEVHHSVVSDPRALTHWLELMRASIDRGETRDPEHLARRIASELLGWDASSETVSTAMRDGAFDTHA